MRRLSVNRPNEKVRGIDRRLRSLERWADSFESILPVYKNQKYWNYKIPVLDRLVSPPTTNREIQKRALESLIKAAIKLSKSDLVNTLPYYRVAVLLILPRMFHSEVTVFYDKEYYKNFNYSDDLLPTSDSPSQLFDIKIPNGFSEIGTLVEWEDEFEPGITKKFSEKRWTIGQNL